MKQYAQHLAAQGRHGDTELLHVSKNELATLRGLGALHNVKLTTNPKTGLPEAFNFASLIPAVIGIGATVMSGGTLSPLTAGLISGAATTAATGDIKQGVVSGITGGTIAGLGQGLVGMAGAGTEAAAAGSLGSGMAGATEAGTAGLAGLDTAGMATQAGTAAGANFGDLGSGMSGVGAEQGLASLSQTAAPATTGMSMEALGNNIQDPQAWNANFGGEKFASRTAPGLMALTNSVGGAMMPGPQTFGPSEADQKSAAFAAPEKRQERDYQRPADPYYAMKGGEPVMFSKPRYNFDNAGFAKGGGIMSLGKQSLSPEEQIVRKIRSRYRSKEAAVEDMQVPNSYMQRLGIMDPNHPIMQQAFGYTKKQGKRKEDAGIMQLVPAMADGGAVPGATDGMADAVPAVIDGQRPAQLSSGEYVVPADSVAHLGNGNTRAGIAQLDKMVAKTRAARTGTTAQAPQINPEQYLP